MQHWNTMSEEILYDAGIFELIKSRRMTDNTQKEFNFHIISSLDWVQVIPILKDGQKEDMFVMIHQFRQGINKATLEFPGGILNKDENPASAGKRELKEESGYLTKNIELLGTHYPNPALFTNTCHVYVAEVHTETTDVDFDETESIETELIPVRELLSNPLSFNFNNATMLASLILFQNKFSKYK